VVHRYAEMVEPADIAVAQRIDVEPHIAIPHGGAVGGAALALFRALQPEYGLVEPRHHRPVRAIDCNVIDLSEHDGLPAAPEFTFSTFDRRRHLPWAGVLQPFLPLPTFSPAGRAGATSTYRREVLKGCATPTRFWGFPKQRARPKSRTRIANLQRNFTRTP